MKNRLSLFVLAAVIPMTCAAASPDTTAPVTSTDQLDNFYVAGNLGQTQYRTSYEISHRDSVFQNVRLGWRWNGLIGAEIGYAYLGHRKDQGTFGESSVNARAATVGANAKYDFYDSWFLTAHGGYLRSERTDSRDNYLTGSASRYTSWNNGWYGGIGLGYDVTHDVSIALNYDNYHLRYANHAFRDQVNVAAYSASVEYRF